MGEINANSFTCEPATTAEDEVNNVVVVVMLDAEEIVTETEPEELEAHVLEPP
jgi:hypothetical protein